MANCPSCGAALPERALFCPNCGVKQADATPVEPVAAPEPAPEPEPAPAPAALEEQSAVEPVEAPATQPVAEPVPEPVVELVAEPVAEPAPEPGKDAWAPSPAGTYPVPEGFSGGAGASSASSSAAQGAWSAPQPEPQAGASFTAQPFSQQPVYAQGCVAAAVNDVKGDPSLVRNSLLLGLISCVPILNFVVEGYAVNWAREIPFGGRTQMPRKIITGHNFEVGFYVFLIALVIGLVAGLASSILALIPLLGWIASLVVSFGASMFQSLMQMRMGITQQLGEGFKVSAVWDVLKRNWTGLFCAALVPSLVAAGVVFVVSLIGVLLMTVAAVPAGFAAGGSAIGAGLGAVAVIAASLVCVALVVVCAACLAVAALVTMRAVAHWVARYAPEWANAAQWSASQNQQR